MICLSPGRVDALRAVCNINSAQSRDHEESPDLGDARQTPHVVPAHQQRPGGGQGPLHVPNQYSHGQDSVRVPPRSG